MALLGSDRMAAFHLCSVTFPSGPYYCTYHCLSVATETILRGILCHSVSVHVRCFNGVIHVCVLYLCL